MTTTVLNQILYSATTRVLNQMPYWMLGQPPPGIPQDRWMYTRPPNTIATINLMQTANLIAQGNYRGLFEFSFDTLQESFDIEAIILGGSIVENYHGLPDQEPSRVPEDIDLALVYTLKPDEIKEEKELRIRQAIKELGDFYYGLELDCRLFEYGELGESIITYASSVSARHQLLNQINEEQNLKDGAEKNPIIYALAWVMDIEGISPLPHFGQFEVLYGQDVLGELKP